MDGRGDSTVIALEPARDADVDAILGLLEINHLPTDGLRDCLAHVVVARESGRIVGSAALELYRSGVLLRSVAVDEQWRGQGLGRRLTEAALALAREHGAPTAFLLTTTAGAFFPRFGFVPIARDDVPDDVRASIEFRSACPSGALVMRANLSTS